MFKSIETYNITDTTGISKTGSGIVTIISASSNSTGSRYGYITIDGKAIAGPSSGNIYLFKSSCKLHVSTSSCTIIATVGLFND